MKHQDHPEETGVREQGLRPVWRDFYGFYALTKSNEVVFLKNYALSPPGPPGFPEPVEDPHQCRVT
jgi:hypothetical protein